MAERLPGRYSPRGIWFVAIWTLATALAVPVGRAIGDSLFSVLAYPAMIVATAFLAPRQLATLDGFELAELAGYVTSMVGISLTVGLAQWLILRGHLRRLRWWWPATSVGFILGALLDLGFRSHLWSLLGETAVRLLSGDIQGIVVGGAQWLLLRQQVVRAGWWIPASAVGWQLGFLARRWSLELLPAAPVSQTLPSLVLGGVAGLVTGVILLWLLRSSTHALNA